MRKLLIALGVCAAVTVGSLSVVNAGIDEGNAAFDRGDWATALKEYRALAEQGDALAQSNLGLMFLTGLGVPLNNKVAMKWFKLAAAQGEVDAQYLLGAMYYDGDGVPQDYKIAMKWYKLVAEKGILPAKSDLGWMYYKGLGVKQDNVYAHMWGNLAATADGDKIGANLRDLVAKEMTPTQLETAQKLAKEWMRKHQK